MIGKQDIKALEHATAYCKDGNKIGSVDSVYLDDQTGEPSFVTINTGLFGTRNTFAPLTGASLDGDRLNLGFGKDVVTGAPSVDADQHIDEAEQDELYRYYSRYDEHGHFGNTYGVADRDGYVDRDRVTDRDLLDREQTVRADVSDGDAYGRDVNDRVGLTDDHRLTDRDRVDAVDGREGVEVAAREEHLVVGKEQREAGRVRIRKYTTTEDQTVTVPVTKEKLVVERVAGEGRVTDGDIDHLDGDLEHEVVLREEVPVVNTEVHERERVRIGKEQVTEQHQVTEQVRKEHVEVDGDEIAHDGVRDDLRDVNDRDVNDRNKF